MPVSYRKSNSKISVNENLPCFGKGDFFQKGSSPGAEPGELPFGSYTKSDDIVQGYGYIPKRQADRTFSLALCRRRLTLA